MKKIILKTIFILLILVIIVWMGFYLSRDQSLPGDITVNKGQDNNQVINHTEIFENYIRSNINELSPEPAVLGGNFYVTELVFMSNNSALVNYEDGHIALKAMITFSITNEEVVLESFEIIPDDIAVDFVIEKDKPNICLNQCGNGACEEIVCMGEGCPCLETSSSCPADCL